MHFIRLGRIEERAHVGHLFAIVRATTCRVDEHQIVSVKRVEGFLHFSRIVRYGPLFCLCAEAGLPLSYFSLGQNVPDDVMPASPGAVAKLVIEGGDDRGGTGTESS